MIGNAPKVMPLPVYFHERCVQKPAPAVHRSHRLCPALTDLNGKHRARSVPTKPDGFVTDVDASLVQQIFDIVRRKREPDIQHNGTTDDLGARLEISKWAVFCRQVTLDSRTARLKPVSSDSAASSHMPTSRQRSKPSPLAIHPPASMNSCPGTLTNSPETAYF
jgi:hypothetical protein